MAFSGVMPSSSSSRLVGSFPSDDLGLKKLRLAVLPWWWARWTEDFEDAFFNNLEVNRALPLFSSDLRGGEKDGAEVEILQAFPFAGDLPSCDAGVSCRARLERLLRSGRAPRRCSFIDAKVSSIPASSLCGDINGIEFPIGW